MTELKKKVLMSYLGRGLNIQNVIGEDFTQDEKEYVTKKMILRIEDIDEKKEAIQNILQIIGEENMELSFEDSEERRNKIKLLQDILIYIQE